MKLCNDILPNEDLKLVAGTFAFGTIVERKAPASYGPRDCALFLNAYQYNGALRMSVSLLHVPHFEPDYRKIFERFAACADHCPAPKKKPRRGWDPTGLGVAAGAGRTHQFRSVPELYRNS